MPLLNPVYSLIVPFLVIFTIPIAIVAGITTTLAFLILLFRVIVVYIELAFAVIPYYLLGDKSSKNALSRTKSFTNAAAVPVRRRKRRGSNSSSLSASGTITPIPGDSSLGLSQSIGPTRDFEGVGGWRLDNPSDDDGVWTNINSRLELPADHVRRHQRSLTSGSMPGDVRLNTAFVPEPTMNTSRARTPPTGIVVAAGEGYFPLPPVSPRAARRTTTLLAGATGTSGNLKGSSYLTMKRR